MAVCDINLKILSLFNINDAGSISSVDIKLTPDNYPSISVHRIIFDVDTVNDVLDVTEEYELKPKSD